MKIIIPSYEIMSTIDGDKALKHIEKSIRVCYKSESLIKPDSHLKIVKRIMESKHESTLEHYSITVKFICNRGFSHELVRHRNSAFSQESSRFCNYSKGKFNKEITVIQPSNFNNWSQEQKTAWNLSMKVSESNYFSLINLGLKPEDARGALPIDVKTEIVMTANVREWRHVFKLRTTKYAHPSMRELMIPLLSKFKSKIYLIFDDINP